MVLVNEKLFVENGNKVATLEAENVQLKENLTLLLNAVYGAHESSWHENETKILIRLSVSITN